MTAETAPAARTGQVVALAAYPIKGLSAESRTSIRFTPGQGVPHDREWALARPDGAYRKGAREPLPKDQFFMLAGDARLAGLTTHVEPEGETLVVQVRGHDVLRTSLGTPTADTRRSASSPACWIYLREASRSSRMSQACGSRTSRSSQTP
ncbi:MAG: MOSC N-terminal beta barrel domain-containing protein [Chloroflexia bacterium]